MDTTSLDSLDFNFVKSSLCSHTYTAMGSSMAESITPKTSIFEINTLYLEVEEVLRLFQNGGTLPLGGVEDVTGIVSTSIPSGSYITIPNILKVRSTLESLAIIKSVNRENFSAQFPELGNYISSISNYKALLSELKSAIDEKGEITDDASYELFDIRKNLRDFKTRVRSKLDSMIVDKKYEGYFQDDIFTLREDRFVLIVKAECHSKIPGVLHGKSSTGLTYFLEPYEIVELNNSLSLLKKDEKIEEENVLRTLTGLIVEQSSNLVNDVATVATLDVVQAKAKFGLSIEGTIPSITGDVGSNINIKNARHPELILKDDIDAIPVDIKISSADKVLVISGANTGGKTVALKTLGLLTLMASSGIPVSADSDSEFIVFENIFTDIGDSQDITENLSTFSAHLKRLSEILDWSNEKTLVLVDEIGVGTDPVEGGVLSLVILEELASRGVVTAVTTHANILKTRAQMGNGFKNVSVEFDEKTMKPFYRLVYDLPGQSMGLSVASVYGIPTHIIDKARAKLDGSTESSEFVESVRELDKQRQELRETQIRLEEVERNRNSALERLRDGRESMLRDAQKKAAKILKDAEIKLQGIISEARSQKAEEILRGKVEVEVSEIGEKLEETFGEDKPYIPKLGDFVKLGTSTGEVTSLDVQRKSADILISGKKVTAKFKNLVPSEIIKEQTSKSSQSYQVSTSAPPREVNIIGMRVEEALPVMDKVLDDAHMKGVETVEVIHGIGTGALSKAVGESLSKNKIVKNYYSGKGSGGAGVTVVEL